MDYRRALAGWSRAYCQTVAAMGKLEEALLTQVVGPLGASGTFEMAKLPPSIAEGIRAQIQGDWQRYGFTDREAAKRFLDGAEGEVVRTSFMFRGVKTGPEGRLSIRQVEFSLRP